jgi:hypothetical protein
MPNDDEKPRWKKGNKARNLLSRFPIIDLAHAVVLNGSKRRAFLSRFVDTITTQSYTPTRSAAPMIYASQKPMFEMPQPTWDEVERYIRKSARPEILDMNLEASRALFDFVRSQEYLATDCDPQALRVRLKNIVPINLSFYVTQGDRLIFQFPLIRKTSLTDDAIRVLGSIIHHAYVQGDYSFGEIEVADISCMPKSDHRAPRIRSIPSSEILDREALTDQIGEVYEILETLAARPPPQAPKGPGGDGFGF